MGERFSRICSCARFSPDRHVRLEIKEEKERDKRGEDLDPRAAREYQIAKTDQLINLRPKVGRLGGSQDGKRPICRKFPKCNQGGKSGGEKAGGEETYRLPSKRRNPKFADTIVS